MHTNNINNNTDVVVWDALMSSGKTTKIIDYMVTASSANNLLKVDNEKFIYVSPYLAEAHRIAATTCDGTDSQSPVVDANGKYVYDATLPQSVLEFRHPNNKNKDGSKLSSMMDLISAKENIVSTHTLLNSLEAEALEQCKDYTLVIDEAIVAYEIDSTLPSKTINRYLENNVLSLLDDGITLKFHRENFGRYDGDDENYDSTKDTECYEFAKACDKGLLYKFNNKIIRKFDVDVLTKFKKVIIMTYMFKGSMFDLLLQQAKLNVEIEYFGKTVESIRHLININMNEKDNAIGDYGLDAKGNKSKVKHTLTSNYFKKDRANGNKTSTMMYNKLWNMWQQRDKVEPSRRLWTCFSDDKMKVSKGKGKTNRYGNQWIAFNTRATNDYAEADHLAFLVNVFLDSNFIKASSADGFSVSQDHHATSILVQWLFRSAIRNGKPIDLYIPSERMRDLLLAWLDGEVPTYNTEGK